ncbi:FAD-dependent oxidoreductase, partial [Streptomyces massasporeus]
RLVPGSRPAGVLTTGELQRLVHRFGARPEHIGRRAVVVGGDPVARDAVRTLRAAGVEVVAVVCEDPARGAAFGAPVLGGAVVSELVGRGRLTGVQVRGGADGTTRHTLRCDTVVFTGDWIPDHELARARGLPLSPGTRGPATDGAFRTTAPGVFAVGNLLRGVEPAVVAAAEGRAVAAAVIDLLEGGPWPEGGVPVGIPTGAPTRSAGSARPLRWVTPGLLGSVATPLLVRPERRLVRPVLTVTQDGVPLRRMRLSGSLVPWRSVRLPARWADGVDLGGGPVLVGAEE